MPDLISASHFGAVLSSVLVDVFGTIGFMFIIGVGLIERARHLRQARAADATHVNSNLAPGPAVLFGEVEYARNASAAVRVDVDQDGEESESSGVWTHKWTEKNRRVTVEPFYLRIDSTKRIRIEPTRDVFLVDSMDGVIRVELGKRTRYAELVPGEKVHACGELVLAPDPEAPASEGYRSSRQSFVLRPPKKQSMLLSSEPLGTRFRDRARFHGRAARFAVALAVVCHVFLVGFHARRYLGQTVDASITKLDHYTTTDDDGDTVHHYRVFLKPSNAPTIYDDVDAFAFARLRVGDVVPMRLVPGALSGRSTIGPDVTASNTAFLLVPIVIGAWFLYKHKEGTTQPWYMRSVVDTGSGRLEESMPHVPKGSGS